MRYLIGSDIHGSYYYGNLLLEQFEKRKCDKLILLGDILYHGPRNDLPKEHDPKKLTEAFNKYKDKIICVKGNCDADIDQMVLEFPILAPYFILQVEDKLVYFTHGDVFNSNNLPAKDIILVHGHTHVQRLERHEDHLYFNPGSIALPKEDSKHGYMILDNNIFIWYDEDGNELNRFEVKPWKKCCLY